MGENAPLMRNDVVEGLSWFGIELDPEKMYSATMVTFQRRIKNSCLGYSDG